MGLKCSLLGHSFGDVDVERDREERGDEVVTIVREVERCTRCGQTRVVSENKEVTTVVEPEDVGVDRDAGAGAGAGFGTGGAGADAGPAVDTGVETDAGGVAGTDDDLDEYEPPEDPAEEDAEIIDDEGAEREPGQWPDDEDESFEADSLTGDDDAAPSDAPGGGPGERADAASGPDGPGEAGDATADAGPGDAGAGRDDEAEILGGGPGGGSGGAGDREDDLAGGDFTVPEGRYVCPECGFRIEASGSSLREGDACPECQRGYLQLESGERNS